MAHYDRDERPLSFEARRPVRGGGPAPVTLILSLMILAAIGGGVFFLYRGGVRGANDAPAPVGAPIGDVRAAAPAEPQVADPAVGLTIYKDAPADPNQPPPPPAFAPPPEQPTARPQLAAAAPPPEPPAAPAARIAAAPAAKGAAAPPAVAVAAAAPAAKTVKPAKLAKKPAPTIEALASAAEGDDSVSPDETAPAPKPAKPAKTAAGGAVVQIGAFASQAQADKGWDSVAGVAPGAMAGKGKKVEVVTRGDETFYRTSVTGFSSRSEALAMCGKLKAAGRTCIVR